jgi:transcriptional regulator with XRE-family HTH domain
MDYTYDMISKELRKFVAAEIERGTSLREIGRKTGIPAGNLSRMLSGDLPPSRSQIDLLGKYLGLRLTRAAKRRKG